MTGILWTSKRAAVQTARAAILQTIYRGAYIEQHGFARTLREMLAQEGYAMARAGRAQPTLESDELEYTREVLAPHLDASDYPLVFACMFGDEAANSLGYAPLGLSPRAGFALALHEALVPKSSLVG